LEELKHFVFEEDTIDFILKSYAEEIILRSEWINESYQELQESLQGYNTSKIIRKANDIINNAMVILRLIDSTGARKQEVERANERVELIKRKWPQIPNDPPEGLRDIRNDYEHFEARLDEWAVTSPRHFIVDMFVGRKPRIGPSELNHQEYLRGFDGEKLHFWDHSVDINEVVEWAETVANSVSSGKRKTHAESAAEREDFLKKAQEWSEMMEKSSELFKGID
jgi:hypothetical protein